MRTIPVVLDACVLHPPVLANVLVTLAEHECYTFKFSEQIFEEACRSAIRKHERERTKIERRFDILRNTFPDGLVEPPVSLIQTMKNPVKDRHVLATAITARAQIIVTRNLRDFPEEILLSFNIEAQSPDSFLSFLYEQDWRKTINVLKILVERLKKPPRPIEDILQRLEEFAPSFVQKVQSGLHFSTEC